MDAVRGLQDEQEALYKDLHAHPELSHQEHETARKVAERLRDAGFDTTTGIGGTGVVGVLANGDGPVVLVRADMDALPVREATGLPYASTVTATSDEGEQVPVAHACGHDVHVTCLLTAATVFARHRSAWRGTLVALFQPAEEAGDGARAMVDDGLQDRIPRPDVALAQHVLAFPAGQVGYARRADALGRGQRPHHRVRTRRARVDAAGDRRPGRARRADHPAAAAHRGA